MNNIEPEINTKEQISAKSTENPVWNRNDGLVFVAFFGYNFRIYTIMAVL